MAKTLKKKVNNVKKKKGDFGLAEAGHAIKKTKTIDNKKKKDNLAAVERFIMTDDTTSSEMPKVGQNVEVSTKKPMAEITNNTEIKNTTISNKKNSFTKVINSQHKIKLAIEDTENLSEYEKIRLENIKEREALFAQLAISQAKDDLRQAFAPISANKLTASNRGLQSEKKVKDETLTPRRQSRRILGFASKTEEEESTKAEPEHIDKYPRLQLEMIDCQETYRGDAAESSKSFLSTLSTAFSKGSAVKDLDLMTESLENLTINENRVAKVVPERIFSVDIHPGLGKLLAAAGGNSGGVGLWDVEDLESATHGVHLYVPHSGPVNCLKWNKYNENQLVSTSYDGTVRALDVEKQKHILLYADQDYNYTNLHCQTGPSTLLVSASNGEVVLVDVRVSNLYPVQTYRLFDRLWRLNCKTFDVHPVEPNYFLSSNNKGFCGVFDARSGGQAGRTMTPVCQLSGHSRGLCSAMFNPISGRKICTLGYDNELRLYNSSTLAGTLNPIASIGHKNPFNPFKMHWRPGQEDTLLMGSMERPRQMEVWRVEGDQMRMEKALRGDQLGSVCSVVAMHPNKMVVIGGNSSGTVHVFM